MKNNNNQFILAAVMLLFTVIVSNAQPAARIGDMHVCPLVTPGIPPVPHVGGPIFGPGCPTVLIGGMPAVRIGDMASCIGSTDMIVTGSVSVFICGLPAARLGDLTAHGGAIVTGLPTVLIGDGGQKGIAEDSNITGGETLVKEPH